MVNYGTATASEPKEGDIAQQLSILRDNMKEHEAALFSFGDSLFRVMSPPKDVVQKEESVNISGVPLADDLREINRFISGLTVFVHLLHSRVEL